MSPKFLLLLPLTILLSGCAKDVDLAKDVDFMVSPKPLQRQMNNQQIPMQQQQQVLGQQADNQPPAQRNDAPNGASQPTPIITPTIAPKAAEPASVSGKQQADILVDLATSKGTLRLKLYGAKAPKTVANFLQKAQNNFYNGLTFHRVEDWVIQGGDPLGNGTGGGSMPTELNQEPFKIGSLGVARGGDINISNDSQFFICTADCSWLTGAYTNFGEVISGMDIAKQIAIGDKIQSIVKVQQ